MVPYFKYGNTAEQMYKFLIAEKNDKTLQVQQPLTFRVSFQKTSFSCCPISNDGNFEFVQIASHQNSLSVKNVS